MMRRTGLMLGSAALALALSLGAPALAQDIDFGDDTSTWADDGQCDDPRFQGEGAALFRSPLDTLRDATDCQAAFEAGGVTLAAEPAPDAATTDTPAGDIDFGDDSGNWANDGECDDPRFGGSLASHEMADATDCRAAYDAGDVTYSPPSDDAQIPAETPAEAAPATTGDIDFGDDSGSFANDGECDDPRFGGALSSHERADATDCQAAYDAGEVTFSPPAEVAAEAAPAISGEIDFGDDSGNWANDGECDDPRFGGALDSHQFADATDCRTAYEAGEVSFAPDSDTPDLAAGDIDFGDDSGVWANDGECDDPRFGGALDSHQFSDATDCRTAYEAGEVTYGSGGDTPVSIDGIDFGNDSGVYATDGECDDPRFTGSGMGASLDDHLMADATDCSTAYGAGTVTLAGGSDAGGNDFRINFGDDSSATAHDGVCDDPRFQGRGAAPELLNANMLADASDCRAAYETGTVSYAP